MYKSFLTRQEIKLLLEYRALSDDKKAEFNKFVEIQRNAANKKGSAPEKHDEPRVNTWGRKV